MPFVTAEATSLAQTRYVNEEIEAILQRLVDKAGGDIAKAQRGIVFIDEIDKLKAPEGQQRSNSGESVQHALLKIMEGSQVKLGERQLHRHDQHPVHLRRRVRRPDEIMSQAHGLRVHLDVRGRQPEDPGPAQLAREADRPLHLRADSGVHRAPAHHRALPGPHARDAGADHDRAAELALRPVPRNLQERGRRAGGRAAGVRSDRGARHRIQDRRAQPARDLRGNDHADPVSSFPTSPTSRKSS